MRIIRNEATAARRAEWLGALAEALSEAERLSARLARRENDAEDAASLRLAIRQVRDRVETMQRAALPACRWPSEQPLPGEYSLRPHHDHIP